MKYVLIVLSLALTNPLFANQFKLAIGGTGNEYGNHMIETSDKGFLIVGYTSGPTTIGDDGLVIKLDKNGKVQWSKTISNTGTDRLYGCIEMNGYYYVVGNTNSLSNGGLDGWCVKLDANGNIHWSKKFGGAKDDGFYKLSRLAGNRLAICGFSGGNGEQYAYLYLVKIGESGNVFWEQRYGDNVGSTQTNSARNMVLTKSGDIILSGYTYCFGAGGHDAIVVSIDTATGTRKWTKSYGSSNEDGFNGIINSKDGNVICTGAAKLDGSPNTKYWVAKLNTKGDTIWQKSYYRNTSNAYSGFISQTEDNGYISVLNELNASGSLLCNIMRLNDNGKVMWAKVFDGSKFELLNTVLTTSDTNYVAMGHTNSFGSGGYDIFIVKLDKYGNMDSCCVKSDNIITKVSKLLVSPQTQNKYVSTQNSIYDNSINNHLVQLVFDCLTKIKPLIIKDTICQGTEYILPGGNITFEPGTYIKNYTAVNGCDSSVITHLAFKALSKNKIKDTALCIYHFDTVQLKAGTFKKYEWFPNGETTKEITVTRPGQYILTTTTFDDCMLKDTIVVETNCPPTLFLPNAFSPNSDNLNDYFEAVGVSIKEFQMVIYNRWGEQLFESNAIEKGWDGRYLGSECQQGVYVFMVNAKSINNKTFHKKGMLTLLR